MNRSKLMQYLDSLLEIQQIPDYCSNGLQVEGPEEINKIGLAVDACMATYIGAKQQGCDLLLTHHGMIWGGLKNITGAAFKQIKYLIENQINLYCAHLPLDKHPEYGNNIGLAKVLKLKNVQEFGNHKGIKIGFKGELPKQLTNEQIAHSFENITGRESSFLSFGKEKNRKVGIISGGASIEDLVQAKQEGLDCYITGEGNHAHYHLALEEGLNVIYLGHYHSEKLGVIALGQHLKDKFGLETVFIDEPSVF